MDNVHRNDPVSSYAAAAVAEGSRQTHTDLVMLYVKRHPGLTASELSAMTGLDVVETRRRLSDAKNAEMAFQSGIRKAHGRKVSECQWWPLLTQGALL